MDLPPLTQSPKGSPKPTSSPEPSATDWVTAAVRRQGVLYPKTSYFFSLSAMGKACMVLSWIVSVGLTVTFAAVDLSQGNDPDSRKSIVFQIFEVVGLLVSTAVGFMACLRVPVPRQRTWRMGNGQEMQPLENPVA